jgi:hypothetical protein
VAAVAVEAEDLQGHRDLKEAVAAAAVAAEAEDLRGHPDPREQRQRPAALDTTQA